MPSSAQDTEAIRAAREIAVWNAAGQPITSVPRWLAKWPPNGAQVREWLGALVEENDRLVARLEAAERERDGYREALGIVAGWDAVYAKAHGNIGVREFARAALAAAAPGETTEPKP